MRRWPVPRVLLATFVALSAAAAAFAFTMRPSQAAPSGVIVFASDRDKFDPGEIHLLGTGSAPRNVSRSAAGEYGLAVAPVGDAIAFWSGRTGTDRVYVARSDGSRLRLVRAVGGDLLARTPGGGGALLFSSDGTRLYATTYDAPQAFLIDPRRATARPVAPCGGIVRPSPDVRLVACGLGGRTTVADLAGRVRFRLPGITGLWSSRGWLTSAPPAAETGRKRQYAVIVDAAGKRRARIEGLPLGWSPDGRRLVLQRDNSLWVVGTGDFSRPRLLLSPWTFGVFSFSPDSRSLLTERNGARRSSCRSRAGSRNCVRARASGSGRATAAWPTRTSPACSGAACDPAPRWRWS